MANARVTSITLDVLRQGDSKARVTSFAVEVLRSGQSKARVTSVFVDVLLPDMPSTEHSVTGVSAQVAHDQVGDVDMTFTQEGVEALVGGDSSFEATTEGVEALVGGDAPFDVTAEGVEVLWSPLVFTGCDSASVFYRVRLVLPGDTEDLVVFTSLPDGDNSVILGEPKIDASTIDVLKGTTTVGGVTISIGDPEAGSCATPDLTDRILTKILADANADFQLLGARMFIEATDNPAPIEIDWLPYWAGYVSSVRFTSAIEVELSGAHTTRDDETTMVWKNRTDRFNVTGNVMGGPTLVNWPSDKQSERLTYFQGAWVMKVTVVQPTYVEFDINEDASANYAGSGAGLAFPPADIRPFIKDIGLFSVSNNDTQRNVFRWAQRNVQPYFSEGGPDATTRASWEAATTEGWFPRLRCVIRTKNGMFVNQEFPVMATIARDIWDLNGNVIRRERSEIYEDLGNKFRIYWPSTDPTPQPAVNDVVTFNVRALDISEANPLLISQHPVDILTNLWDELDIEYDAASAAEAKSLLGEFVAALRITEPMSLKDAQTMICAGFGIGWRFSPDGLRYLFTTRVRPTVQGTITIEDLVGSNGAVWEADEQSRLFSASYEWKRFKVWPGDEDGYSVDRALDGVQSYDVGPITFQTDDIGDKPYGSRDEQYKIPGSVYALKDGEVAPQWSISDHVDITASLTAPLLEQFGRGGIMTTIDINHCVDVQEGEDWLLELIHRPGFDSTYSPVSQRGLVERVQCISRTPHAWGTTVTFIRVPQDSVSVVPITVDVGTAEPLTITFEVLDATATGGTAIDETEIDETFTAFPFYASFVLSANGTLYYDDLDVVVDVEYSETFAAPADDSVFRLRLAPWDGIFPVSIGTFDPDALVWYRTRVRFGAYVGAWAAWDSVQLTNTTQTPVPTVSLTPDGSFNIDAEITGPPTSVRLYVAADTTTYPDEATTLLATPISGSTASIAAIIPTLAEAETAYVTAIAEDLFGNRSIVSTSFFTRPGGGGGGGGAPIYTKYDPFCPPASPSSLDDEFNVDGSGTPAGWTAQGGAPVSSVVKNGKWVVTPILSGGRNMAAIEKTLPSGPFTIITHAVNEGYDLFHHVDLFVRSSVSGRIYCNRMYCGPSSNNRFMDLAAVNMTSFTTDNAGLAFRNVYTNYGFFRIAYDGTTLYFDFSDDGIAWRRIGSTAMTSWFTGGNLPDRFGVACASVNGSNNMEASFEFVRYFPTAFADFGRNIGVGSDGSFVDPLALLLHNKVI